MIISPVGLKTCYNDITRIKYNDQHKPTLITFPNGSTIKASYYGNGLLKNFTDQIDNTYSCTYNSFGDLFTFTTPSGTYTIGYDSKGFPTFIVDRNGKKTSIETDDYGNIIRVNDPMNFTIERRFDANGNLTSIKDKNGFYTYLTYNKQDLLIKITDALGYQTLFEWDALNRLVKVINSKGGCF